jgi:hypothetical protein
MTIFEKIEQAVVLPPSNYLRYPLNVISSQLRGMMLADSGLSCFCLLDCLLANERCCANSRNVNKAYLRANDQSYDPKTIDIEAHLEFVAAHSVGQK